MRDVGTAIEGLRLENGVHLLANLAVIRAKREFQPGPGIKDHDGNTIARRQHAQCGFLGVCSPFNMRLHAAAYVQQ
jgi:hypothetical protein